MLDKNQIENKLNLIADIWNTFILESNFCSSKIKFNEDIKTNYIGDIFGYFQDTLNTVFSIKKHSNFADKFSFTVSFLQAIYIQQDFIQEMLEVFATKINKGTLKLDLNYSINRDLRNELIGHPIRKAKNNSLISSTIFSYEPNVDLIQYLRYHKDNNFKFESKTYVIAEIQKRHYKFLEIYLDLILVKLKSILNKYNTKLELFDKIIAIKDFNKILNFSNLYLEVIHKSHFAYNQEYLLKIYNKKDTHKRYQNFIDHFFINLTHGIIDIKKSINNVFTENKLIKLMDQQISEPQLKDIIRNLGKSNKLKKNHKRNYNYEIGKLSSNRNSRDFSFFGGILKSNFQNHKVIAIELINMEDNIDNEVEYYTSLELIKDELKKE